MTMTINIDPQIIGGFIALAGMLLSGTVTWLYLQRAKSSRGRYLTRRKKYLLPLLPLAGTSFITCFGLVLVLRSSASPEMTHEVAWVVSSTIAIFCSGFLFVWLILSYLVNLWWHGQNSKPPQDY